MAWHCPACRTQIRLPRDESRPEPISVYRCHVCHLDLQVDPTGDQMMITPFETDHLVTPAETRRRVTPAPVHPRSRKPS